MDDYALIINSRETFDGTVTWEWYKHDQVHRIVRNDANGIWTLLTSTTDPAKAQDVFDHPYAEVA